MAICQDCQQEMNEAASCSVDVLILSGRRYPRDRAGEPSTTGRCPDCGVRSRGYHHLGCDLEDCPACRRQLLSCGCGWADEETEDLVAVAGDLVVYPASLRGLRNAPDPAEPWGFQAAKELVNSNIAPALTAAIRPWLPRVTDGRYTDVSVSPESLQVEVRGPDGVFRGAEVLSHGTMEQAYLLLRMALADHLGSEDERAPLILDDVTVQSDAGRTTALLDLIHELSADRQVVLFSQEEEVIVRLGRSACPPRGLRGVTRLLGRHRGVPVRPRGPLDAEHSDEHVEVAWFALDDLPLNLPNVYRRAIVAASDT